MPQPYKSRLWVSLGPHSIGQTKLNKLDNVSGLKKTYQILELSLDFFKGVLIPVVFEIC
jgi:hypothetical protein